MSEAKTTWVHRTEEGEITPDTATREQLLEILEENGWTAPKNGTREQLLGLVDRLKMIEELKALKSKTPGISELTIKLIDLAISEIEKNGL